MRLSEITPQNNIWILLNNFNQRYSLLEDNFNNITVLAEMSIKLKRKSKFNDIKEMNSEFTLAANELLSILKRSPDLQDVDVIQYRHKILNMKKVLDNIVKSLV